MKKVLVTGAAGAIGNTVIKYLLSEGKYEITVIDLKNKQSMNNFRKYRKRVNIVYGDITDPIITDALVKDHDYIIHLAGIIPPLANTKKELMELIDYKATENIIRAIQFYNKKCKLLYISSTSIYDNSEGSEVSVTSKLTTNEFDYYSLGKIKIEKLIKDNIKNYVIFRVPIVLSNLKKFDFIYTGIRSEKVEVITVEDVAYAIVKAIEKDINGKTFNLSGGENCITTYNELLIKILKYYGLSWKYIFQRVFASKDFHGFIYKDGDKLNDLLSFRNDSIDSYFMRLKRNNKNRTVQVILAKPIIKLMSLKKFK